MVSVEVEVDFVVARGGEEVAVELKGCEVSVDGDYVGKEFGLVGLVLGVDVERTEGLVVDHAVLDLEVGVEAGVGFKVFGLDGALQGALDGDRLRCEEKGGQLANGEVVEAGVDMVMVGARDKCVEGDGTGAVAVRTGVGGHAVDAEVVELQALLVEAYAVGADNAPFLADDIEVWLGNHDAVVVAGAGEEELEVALVGESSGVVVPP